jgi:hypothetical protein
MLFEIFDNCCYGVAADIVAADVLMPQIPFKSCREDTVKSLLEAFPDDGEAIRKYFDMLDDTRQRMRDFVALKAMPAWMGRLLVGTGLINWYTDFFQISGKTTTATLEGLTDNAALRAVLSYNFGKDLSIVLYCPVKLPHLLASLLAFAFLLATDVDLHQQVTMAQSPRWPLSPCTQPCKTTS